MYILGISAYYHDAAAALIQDGKIIVAAEEERFTRIKHDASFPYNAIKCCLDFAAINLSEVKAVVFYDKPLLKFERLLETYFSVAPKGWISFLKAIPVWVNQKLFLKRSIHQELSRLPGYSKKNLQLLFTEHHLSHAASAFYPSCYEKAAVLTIDGVGEWATTSIAIGEKNSIQVLKEMHFPNSVGLLYSAFTYYLGFKVNSGEYKLMGLAPYGNVQAETTQRFVELIKRELCQVHEDGSIILNREYFTFEYSLRMVDEKRMHTLFGFSRRLPENSIEQYHCDLALAIQMIIEEIILKLANYAKQLTKCEYLCLAGGVALNSVANGKLHSQKIFKDIFVQPAAGDSGGALGAALAGYYLYFNSTRNILPIDSMQGALLGPAYDENEIEKYLVSINAIYTKCKDINQLTSLTANLLADGKVVGWFHGRMEFGPRALGNRSILADPRNEEIQKKLNLKIKNREGFRPFAPAILAEKATSYFNLDTISPYMLLVKPIADKLKCEVPTNYQNFSLWDKLYQKRSALPAVTHVDFSARVQTVHSELNPLFHQLLIEFEKKTGVPVLVNTSFNVRGEPIVCTPKDAYQCLVSTELDVLVIDHYILFRKEQPLASHKLATFSYD